MTATVGRGPGRARPLSGDRPPAVHHWDQASIGITLSTSATAGPVARTPGGTLADAVRAKRGLTGAAHPVFAPAIATITLGLAGRTAFPVLAGIAAAATLLFWLAMPETGPKDA
ncbi:hypothetical protein SAMN02927895_03034 [Belnapia rosea]|uniref:Uncharacterized protein n=1 Tax=Belnapia rosea TaxID=938405 RepID=A0A1G6ZNU4_9PROT|nr:hypothetical protein SAMN02927895_03034 [Belnapia rosea]SDE04162.1 hypothetical protein SAMN04487779_101733 [Belnapia rosea]